MKQGNSLRNRRGISPVIATIILSAVVITIGGAVWSYSQGAAIVIATDYVNGTLTLMNDVIERFVVEHVSKNNDGSVLYVWIYNHGSVDVLVDVYANSTQSSEYIYKSTLGTTIVSGDIKKVEVSFQSNPLQSGDEVVIKVHSRRQNNAYYIYYVS